MASHKDIDVLHSQIPNKDSEVYSRLNARGIEMMKRQLSTITAGNQTDEVLYAKVNGKVTIKQLSVDPDCLRISIGEVNSSEREKYLVFRGDARRVRIVLQRMLREMDEVIAEGHI